MNDDEDIQHYTLYYIEKCMHCDFYSNENVNDPYIAQCQLCDRFFVKKKLFLNNVG